MRGAADQKNGVYRSRQPRALEDGNWVCDDSHCSNVNYPRRTEVNLVYLKADTFIITLASKACITLTLVKFVLMQCNKCKKKRGPAGDAVVKAYLDSLNVRRGEVLHPLPMGHSMVRCLSIRDPKKNFKLYLLPTNYRNVQLIGL